MGLSSALPYSWLLVIHVALVTGFALRLIWVRRPVGVAIAWFLVVAAFSGPGLLLYVLIGERPVGRRVGDRIRAVLPFAEQANHLLRERFPEDAALLPQEAQALARLAGSMNGSPVIGGNRLALFSDSLAVLQAFVQAIEAARHACFLEFYIWHPGGEADRVAEALIRAARRGVVCRVLLDAVGSGLWFKSGWPGQFAAAGIAVVRAMPIEWGRLQYARLDLRLHRKLFIIDSQTAWTGSMNLVDPRVFKQDAKVGEWVDGMLKVTGPVVIELQLTFLFDWAVNGQQTESPRPLLRNLPPPCGPAPAQTLASGPVYRDDVLYQVLISAILDARRQLIITTPYFGPDDGLVQALCAAARRGVEVVLIVPQHNDSRLVGLSSRSFYADLLEAGVRIAEFEGGLLHTKSLLIDESTAIFGSVNFDLRSLRLNFEISLIIYDEGFGQELKQLQQSYLQHASDIDPMTWSARPRWKKLLENAAYLLSPLL